MMYSNKMRQLKTTKKHTHKVQKCQNYFLFTNFDKKRRYTFVIYLSWATCWQYITDIEQGSA